MFRRKSSGRRASRRFAPACGGGGGFNRETEDVQHFEFFLGQVKREDDADVVFAAGTRHAVKRVAVGIEDELAVRIGSTGAVEGMQPRVGAARGIEAVDSAVARGAALLAALGSHAVEHAADGDEVACWLLAEGVLR